MATSATDIVQKLWNLCTLLKEDGVTYHQYVTELTYLLFLKMMKEQGREEALPKEYRWGQLTKLEGVEQLDFYKRLLLELGKAKNRMVRDIYENATTTLKKPKTLALLVKAFDELDWYSSEREGVGDLYEGLLEKNATEVKSGAGQYFTPRPLVRAMVECLKPAPGELIQDPAAGTAGFLIEADRYIKSKTDGPFDLPAAKQECWCVTHTIDSVRPARTRSSFSRRCWCASRQGLPQPARVGLSPRSTSTVCPSGSSTSTDKACPTSMKCTAIGAPVPQVTGPS